MKIVDPGFYNNTFPAQNATYSAIYFLVHDAFFWLIRRGGGSGEWHRNLHIFIKTAQQLLKTKPKEDDTTCRVQHQGHAENFFWVCIAVVVAFRLVQTKSACIVSLHCQVLYVH